MLQAKQQPWRSVESNTSRNFKYHLKMSSDGFLKWVRLMREKGIWPGYTFNKPCQAIHILCSPQCWWDLNEMEYVEPLTARRRVVKQFTEKTTQLRLTLDLDLHALWPVKFCPSRPRHLTGKQTATVGFLGIKCWLSMTDNLPQVCSWQQEMVNKQRRSL